MDDRAAAGEDTFRKIILNYTPEINCQKRKLNTRSMDSFLVYFLLLFWSLVNDMLSASIVRTDVV